MVGGENVDIVNILSGNTLYNVSNYAYIWIWLQVAW